VKAFARRLKELRAEKGLSTVALAKALGISKASITNWELGTHDIKSEYLIRIAKFFDTTPNYLLGFES